jgi:endogenous inhibitor of DNA gyrase (YacG/DUF329 family)
MGDSTGGKVVPLKRKPCPICKKPPVSEYLPFCSKRCADIDLGQWLDEGYRIPTNQSPDDPDAEDAYSED